MSGSQRQTNCCTSCCRTLILSGFSFLFTFIIYRATTKGPRLYLADISATGPAPNLPPALTCQIEIKNRAKFLGIYYDDLHVSVTFPPAGPNGSATVPAFYQGFHKRAFKDAALPGAPWAAAKAAAAAAGNNAPALLRVEVDTRFRYKAAVIWKSKRYGLSVSEDVQVNADGKMTAPEHILLRSAAARPGPTACVAAGTTAAIALLSMM